MNRNNTQYVDFLARFEVTDAKDITDHDIEQLRDSVFWSLENDRVNDLLRFGNAPYEAIDSVTVTRPATIDLVLFCPECHKQHIDAPGEAHPLEEHEPRWTNPPHRSHLCHFCGIVWRPADFATNGVAQIQTRGRNDTWPSLKQFIDADKDEAATRVLRSQGMAPALGVPYGQSRQNDVSKSYLAETIIAGDVTFVAADAATRSFAEAFAPHTEGRRYTGLELIPVPPASWSTAPPAVEGTYFFRPLNGPVDQAAVMRVFYCSSSDALCAESQLDRLAHQPIRFVVEVLKGEWCLAHGDKNLLTGDR